MQPAAATSGSPAQCSLIYVDLDGTLIRSDLLLESVLAFLRHTPWRVLSIFAWALRGRAHLKARLAESFDLDAATLPYHTELLAYLRQQVRDGQRLILATASNERLAGIVADHLGIFTGTLASSEQNNLKGKSKHEAINAHCGAARYTYVGNDISDIHIWRHSHAAVLVNASGRTTARAHQLTNIAAVFPREQTRIGTYVKAIRVYQWTKNFLLFVPLITAHLWADLESFLRVLVAWGAFSLCASSIYLVNDLLDLSADRAHPRKRHRPIAAGAIPIDHALALSAVLLLGGIVLASLLGPLFLGLIVFYVAMTTAYSLLLKTYVLIDVMTLAGLYTVRIIGGAIAVAVTPSFWLLAFSVFIFLSLALVKRFSELQMVASTQTQSTRGRDYVTKDLNVVLAMGVASGFAAVQVFAMYIDSSDVAQLYSRPELLWLLCGTILYWIGRMWIKAGRGEMHDDPLLFAARDRGSLFILAISLALIVGAAL